MLLTMVLALGVCFGVGYANEEITVELPGGTTMEMVWIEPGTFLMGSLSSEPGSFSDQEPQHEVTISQGFYLGKYEITQEQWEAVMGSKPSHYKGPNQPVVWISWNDVQAFIHRLNEAAGDSLYRLPTEAEWEYSCRAGMTTAWSSGNDESQLGDYAWYKGNNGLFGTEDDGTKDVGTKLPNPWGLHDMHGNMSEWCQDWWSRNYYSVSPNVDPTGPISGSERVIRGGSYDAEARYVRSAFRYRVPPDARGYMGARLLRMAATLTPVTPRSWGKVKSQLY